ncbi:MAG: hypothetical protein AAFP91_18450, partial [Pseudomonadota bacterium]
LELTVKDQVQFRAIGLSCLCTSTQDNCNTNYLGTEKGKKKQRRRRRKKKRRRRRRRRKRREKRRRR